MPIFALASFSAGDGPAVHPPQVFGFETLRPPAMEPRGPCEGRQGIMAYLRKALLLGFITGFNHGLRV